MTTSDNDKANESNPQDRHEDIKKEAQEDASSYYAQEKTESPSYAEEFKKTMPTVDKEQEDLSMLKAVAFLGFGLAAFAIIFILFFIRDLDDRVVGVDSEVGKLEEMIAPLKQEVNEGFTKVNADLEGLKTKVGNYERKVAVMELKRTLVTVQEMYRGTSPEVEAKSGQVIASIESLLKEFGADSETPSAASMTPAGEIKMEEAPATEEPGEIVIEEPALEPEVEASAEETMVDAAPAAEEEAPAEEQAGQAAEESSEEAAEEGGDEEEGGEDDEEEED